MHGVIVANESVTEMLRIKFYSVNDNINSQDFRLIFRMRSMLQPAVVAPWHTADCPADSVSEREKAFNTQMIPSRQVCVVCQSMYSLSSSSLCHHHHHHHQQQQQRISLVCRRISGVDNAEIFQ